MAVLTRNGWRQEQNTVIYKLSNTTGRKSLPPHVNTAAMRRRKKGKDGNLRKAKDGSEVLPNFQVNAIALPAQK